MFNSFQNKDLSSGQKQSTSKMARYGQLGVSGQIKPFTISLNDIKYGQSLTDFQSQLSRMAANQQFKIKKKYLQRNKRAYTQIQTQPNEEDQVYTQKLSGRTSNITPIVINTKTNDSTKQLHRQLEEIKKMIDEQSKINSMQARFQKLYQQIQKKNSQQSQPPYFNPYGQFPMYPPNYMYNQPYQYPPQYDEYSNKTSHRKRKQSESDDALSNYTMNNRKNSRNQTSRQLSTANKVSTKKPSLKLNRNWATHLLKKYFYAVTFISFLKKESKKMASIRKTNLRKFWLQKFQSQVTNMKNWLCESMKYALSIILQKKQLNFDFFSQKRQKVKKQKQKLVLQLVYLCVEQMKKLSNPKDVSLFGEILVIVCQNGSFPISRFWTINEIQKLRISEYYGFIRADQWTQKMMILLFVFMKVLIFNMLLQPYKYDSINFTKTSQPLLSNMFLIASVLYHIVKQVIEDYLNEPKIHEMYQPGNWLKVKKEFICECCEPLVYNSDQYEKGEYISGMLEKQMFNEMLQDEQNFQKWQAIRQKIRSIIDSLYIEMRAKGKMLKSNIKFKMYN